MVTAPVFEDGAQTNGLSRGIRSISAMHILLCITLSVVSVTETKQRPSVSQVKLSFVQRWQKHCNAKKKTGTRSGALEEQKYKDEYFKYLE